MKSKKVPLVLGILLVLIATVVGVDQLFGQAAAQEKPAKANRHRTTATDVVAAVREAAPDANFFGPTDSWVTFRNDAALKVKNVWAYGTTCDGYSYVWQVHGQILPGQEILNDDLEDKFVSLQLVWQGPLGNTYVGPELVAPTGKFIYYATAHWIRVYDQHWDNEFFVDCP